MRSVSLVVRGSPRDVSPDEHLRKGPPPALIRTPDDGTSPPDPAISADALARADRFLTSLGF